MPTENDILLRLIISGQNPAEIERLAASTQGALNERMKVYLDHLTQLHAQAAQAQTAEDTKRAKAAIDSAEKQIEVVAKVMRANEIAANRSSNAWRRTLEDMENITTVAFGVGVAFDQLKNRAFALAEDIDKLTNVYGSLKGSIDEMRAASAGEISDFDLISTKNRALELDLQLTDKQFGIVARAADNYADSIGVNTKEAMDQLIQGLGTGKTKALEHAGALKDVNDVYKRFAESIGTTADKLSDQGKRVAVVEEALRNLDKKNKESGALVEDFSHKWEKFTAETKNLADAFKIHLGEAIVFVFDNLKAIPDVIELVKAKFMDLMSFGKTDNYSRVASEIVARQEQAQAAAQAAQQSAATASGPGDLIYQGDRSRLINTDKLAADAKRAADERARLAAQFDAIMRKAYAKSDEGLGYDSSVGRTPNLDALGFTESTAMGNEEGQRLEQGTLDALLNQATGGGTKGQSLSEQVEKFEKDFIEPLKQKTQAYQAELDATKEKEGGGLFHALLFGPDEDGHEQLYEEMDRFQQATADMSGAVSDTIHKMAEQVGAEMANWIANTQGAKKSFRDVTNELLVALSTKAFVKGLEELAEAAASAAHYDASGVALHLEAAAAWGALGVATGLGARAVGHSGPSATDQVAANKRAATERADAAGLASDPNYTGIRSRGGSASAGGAYGYSSSGSSATPGNVTINVTVGIGQEAEVGRGVFKALKAYQAETGQTVAAP